MAENNRPVSEPLQKGAQAAQMVQGAVKTGKAIAGAAKGAAAGGPYGAAAGLIWENRKTVAKVIIVVIAFLMIPVMVICMLPSLIFGDFESTTEKTVLNDASAIAKNINDISASVNTILSEALTELENKIDNDFSSSGADQKEVVNPYKDSLTHIVTTFISQYCAHKGEDFKTVSSADLESMIRQNKGKLYLYTKREESRSYENITVTVDSSTGKETLTTTIVTETWMVYTIVYHGEEHFADQVFHLSAKQKELAADYAENLMLFLGDMHYKIGKETESK